MILEFFNESYHVSRKDRRCDACRKPIKKGERYSSMRMKYDGEFSAVANHEDCRKAECELAELHGLYGGEDWLFVHDLEQEDRDWLKDEYPAVYARAYGETGTHREKQDGQTC